MIRATLLLVLATWISFAHSQDYQTQKIASGLKVPWGMAFFDDNTLLVTERNGHILTLNTKTGSTSKLMENPSNLYSGGQGGWLDIALSPFEKNKFYVTYSQKTQTGSDTALASFLYQSGKLSQFETIFTSTSKSDTSRHFGSRLTFDNNHLFMSIGDRGKRPNGQDLSTHAGTILRLNPDGSPAKDNPFITLPNAQKELWSIGHRNPQGLFYDGESETLWSIEHGPRGGDEINLIKRGANYGWPITSHGKEYWGPINVADATEKEGIESPIKVYAPSIAPASLLLYRGRNYPELNGKLLAPALKLKHINVITINNTQSATEETRILENLEERIRHVIVSPKGEIIFSTDQGNIYRLIKSN
ncbi:PQQ-dependent sugar dehydrogenase [Vibrio pectenicida]|uniref:PQQ-dependent sugar dehydrogenase n=1 Tax=Vibrio pectenicida TaxID=62763 RepID=A0A7Y3ZZW3_9VIBR|nr:PQQ-dependent sugar dehydrogenase [Vibrio pectenicida]NOH71294.1 PQQ-dependent sugar dehydrogenase [Vibrio pectenicida]